MVFRELRLVAAVVLTLRFRTGTRKQNPADQARVKASDRLRMVKMATVKPQPAAPAAGQSEEPQA